MKKEIETKRLLLRKFSKEDVEPMFYNWASDAEVTKYLTWNPHQSIEETRKIIDYWVDMDSEPQTIRFAITLKESKELIGSIDVVRYKDGNPEVGYCLSRKHWNKGYMTEALHAFIDYLFSLGYSSILIKAVDENIASNRVIQKCGFTFTHQEKISPISPLKSGEAIINCYRLDKVN